jgi:thiol-disulfide isomerase/thioredoxin
MTANRPRNFRALAGALTALFTGASAFPLLALQPGDAVTLDALAKAEFVQGKAPKAWEPDQVYVLECWATWCGPCVAAIPHVDALYDKYQPKGFNVIGVNVLEDGRDKVAKFVTKKGDGMSYPVAYTGGGGKFEEEWLQPAGVNSIPHAFVVKNGKLLFMMHPAALTEKMVETLLAGGEAEAALVRKVNRAKDSQGKITDLTRSVSEKLVARDFAAAAATVAEIRELDENHIALPGIELQLAAAQEKWDEVLTRLKQDKTPMLAMGLGLGIEMGSTSAPTSVLETLVRNLDGSDESDPISSGVKAALLAKLGKRDEGVAAAEKAAKAFVAMSQGALTHDAFGAYVKSHKTDKPMALMEAFAVVKKALPQPGK